MDLRAVAMIGFEIAPKRTQRSITLGLLGCLLGVTCAPAGCSNTDPDVSKTTPQSRHWFQNDATNAGLAFRHSTGHSGGHYLMPEIMVGGAAVLDIDGDGDLDIYLVQSGSLHPDVDVDARNRLFRNRGGGTFDDVTTGSGADDRGYGVGVCTGDYDSDGDVDLYVTNVGPNVLLRNLGDGTFEDVSDDAGVADPGFGASAAFVDYDRDGDLDLFVANYVNWSIDRELECSGPSGQPDYCSPNSYQAPAGDTLYRNDGDGTFTDVSAEAGFRTAFGNGLGVVCSDFDQDGHVDIFVANDQLANQLWHNEGDGTFRDIALMAGCGVDLRGEAKAGMGVTADDVDDDGDLDILVVNLQAQSDSFFRNEGAYFIDDTSTINLGASSRRYTRFGMGLHDFDNDGWLDLFEANGRVSRSLELDSQQSGDEFAQPNVVYRGRSGGSFDAMPPLPEVRTSRAAAFGDLDGDGGLDIVVVNRDEAVSLWRNVHPSRGHWIVIDTRLRSGGPAIGATVTMHHDDRTIRREVRTAYSYCAANDPRVHFGLGEHDRVDSVDVHWPDGETEAFTVGSVDRVIIVRQGEGNPRLPEQVSDDAQ